MKCIDLLTQEHKVILRALDVLDHMAVRVANNQPVDVGDIGTLVRFLHAFADDNHQTKEETALFPELMRTTANNNAALRQMIFEHNQERSLVEGLEDALHTKKGTEFVYFANRLIQLIRAHIRKEDNILFVLADGCLSAEQDERVATEINQYQIDSHFLSDLRRLEWAYLRKAA